MDEVTKNLSCLLNGNNLCPSDIDFVHVCHGGDHGKDKFRFTTKLIVKMKNGKYYEVIFPLADIKCSKDSGTVIKNTILDKIDSGINSVATSRVEFTHENGTWHSSLAEANVDTESHPDLGHNCCTPETFISGDLAFLCMIVGKEGYEGDWCYLCDLFHTHWQQQDHNVGVEWTTESLKEKHELNQQLNAKGTKMCGVRERPFFQKVKHGNIIFSVLHAMMGIGNAGVDYLVDFMEQHIENLPQEEVGLKNHVLVLSQRLAEARTVRDEWEKGTLDGKKWKGMPAKIKYRERRLESGKGNMMQYQADIAKLNAEWVLLELQHKLYTNPVKELAVELSTVKERIKQMRADRKTEEGSMYTAFDKILVKYKVERSAYHAGQINGVGIKLIMENAEGIMGDVYELMLRFHNMESTKTVTDLNAFCTDVKLFFGLWDDAFAAIHVHDPSPSECNRAQVSIDAAMRQMRRMGMSITPKAHGMEDHVVNQMRRIRGGIMRMIEHWVERYHQIGYKYDDKWRKQKGEHAKAVTRAHREHIERQAEVAQRVNLLKEMYATGPRKRTLERRDESRVVKKERREISLREAAVLHAVPGKDDTEIAAVLCSLAQPGTQGAAVGLLGFSSGAV